MDNKITMRKRQLARAAKAKMAKLDRVLPATEQPYQLRPVGFPVLKRTIGFPRRSAMMHYIRRHKLYPAIMSGKLVGYYNDKPTVIFNESYYNERRED